MRPDVRIVRNPKSPGSRAGRPSGGAGTARRTPRPPRSGRRTPRSRRAAVAHLADAGQEQALQRPRPPDLDQERAGDQHRVRRRGPAGRSRARSKAADGPYCRNATGDRRRGRACPRGRTAPAPPPSSGACRAGGRRSAAATRCRRRSTAGRRRSSRPSGGRRGPATGAAQSGTPAASSTTTEMRPVSMAIIDCRYVRTAVSSAWLAAGAATPAPSATCSSMSTGPSAPVTRTARRRPA